jgi:GDP-D-mannose 3',5'-epimerase
MSTKRVLVAGGGGFIGGHLVKSLLEDGVEVRAADLKPLDEWWQLHPGVESVQLDLSDREAALQATRGVDEVYDLAADMGGMGFIENNKAACMLSVLTGTHLLLGARDNGVGRFFFASSACVYAAEHQTSPDVVALKESDAYPAMPEDGYGWEKLFTERLCRHFHEDFGLETRIARYHNVYGPNGSWTGGREKAPAAICRKVAQAALTGDRRIEVWGDGLQTRSFMFVDDCVYGTRRLMDSNVREPINIGSSELVTINGLIDIVSDIAGIEVDRSHDLTAPQGVRGRNSDNTLSEPSSAGSHRSVCGVDLSERITGSTGNYQTDEWNPIAQLERASYMTGSRWFNATRKAAHAVTTATRRRALRSGVATDPVHDRLLSELQPQMVIDVGANGGQFALAALEASPTTTVMSFEPQSGARERYRRAISDRRAELRPCALGARVGSAIMHVSKSDDNSSLLPILPEQERLFPGAREVGVETILVSTLDDEIKDVPDRTLLKLDVQGFELEVLRGGGNVLRQVEWVLSEISFEGLYGGQARPGEVIALLAEHGFEISRVVHLSMRGGRSIQADLLFERHRER